MLKDITKQAEVQAEKQEESVYRTVRMPEGDILVDARADLMALGVKMGLKVMSRMFLEDVEGLCGPARKRNPERKGSRWGTTGGEVSLGGRRVAVKRPRVRNKSTEVPLMSYEVFNSKDLLGERVLGQIFAGVSERRYERSLETQVPDNKSRSTSRSAVSRRFVAHTTMKIGLWMNRSLKEVDLVLLFIDGIEMGDHTLIVAIGVDIDGKKHALGAWEGATENSTAAKMLLMNLIDRGLRVDEGLLVVIDGSKALRKAVRDVLGKNVPVQRCQQHKIRNVLRLLPNGMKTSVELAMRQAYQSRNVNTARKRLKNLARVLDEQCPGAAASLREGMNETLTVIELGLPKTLRRSCQTTNIIESMLSIVRDVSRNVKRWRSGRMALRWTATGLMEAERRVKRIRGYKELNYLRKALQKRRQAEKPIEKSEQVA
jgi:transposase-like protein